MRYAVIDIGSNTIRMNVYDIDAEGTVKRVLTQCENLGLLNYEAKKAISDDGIFKLIATLTAFDEITKNVLCDRCFYFATASLRAIDNAGDVVSIIKERLGITIEIISGEKEALLSFEGLKMSFPDARNGIMIDMGGGSTELLGFVDGLAVRAVSQTFGSLSLYKKYISEILPKKNELKELKTAIDRRAADICWLKNYGDTAYLVGGTARATGKIRDLLFKNGVSEPICAMKFDELRDVYDYIKKPDREVIDMLVRIAPDRLHTVIPGVTALLRILTFAEVENIIISPTGIREGFLVERVMKSSSAQ